MKENNSKKSKGRQNQTKITSFYTKALNRNLQEEAGGGGEKVNGKKRKNEEEISEIYRSPKKIAPRLQAESPDIFSVVEGKESMRELFSSLNDKENEIRNDFLDFDFGDFENDPFSSPTKAKCRSPNGRRSVLTENRSQSSSSQSSQEKSELNFEIPQKCRVLKTTMVTSGRVEQILTLKEELSERKGICKLRDVWTFSSISVDDVVSVQTIESEDGWVVDNKSGYLVLHPDIVVSSTALVSSMFCMRQGFLSNLYKEMDSGGNDRMLMGRLVHELLEESLKTRASTPEDLSGIVKSFLRSRDHLRDFYFSDMTPTQIQNEMESFIPRIRNFLDVYVEKKTAPTGKNFNGTIEDVLDVEELIKSPSLGFQGRIDITVKVKSKKRERVAPLELKTGRASFSREHRNQIILYVLLMNELGRKVESGLLLYLRENIMEEIVPERDEIRNLFLLRNQLVGFYKNMKLSNLPEPIRNSRACKKCPYLRVCTSYLKGGDRPEEKHPLAAIEIPDVERSHVDYFMKWNRMLWLEYGGVFDEKMDECEMTGLKLKPDVESFKDEFKHNFVKSVESGGKNFQRGAFVHVMNGNSIRISTGRIVDVTDSVISVLMDRKLENLTESYRIQVFKSKFLNIYLSNLGWFLEEQFAPLRQVVIDRREPTFKEKFDEEDVKKKCSKMLEGLNAQQQNAVLRSLLCNDYLLIKGPPGTGKTQTIAALIRVLLALDQSVLVVSHTHSAVDNILLRLEDVDYLRLGALKSVHGKTHEKCYAKLSEKCSSVEDVAQLFERKVIASTCMGTDADLIKKRKFDVCVVDESSQVLQPEILKPLFCARKFVLVGDEDQLRPVVQNPEARKFGMDESMFEWLSNETATVCLKFQYRMNSAINSLANSIAYNGLIECGSREVAEATLQIDNREEYLRSEEWIVEVMSPDLDKSAMFVDTSAYFDGKEAKESRSSFLEANILVKLIASLIRFGVDEESIGVIAPYCDQVELLRRKLMEANVSRVELNTVDQYQGRDKEVILFSCSKENQRKREASETELLNDKRRLTVAVTRAKRKLIVVGDRMTMVRYEPFKKLFESLNDFQFVCLSNGEKDFFWENFLD